MNTQITEPYSRLLGIIDNLQRMLILADQRGTMTREQRKQKVDFIEDLKDILKGLEFYDLHPLYLEINKIIKATQEKDDQIEGFDIQVNFKPRTNKISKFTINLFNE